MGPSLKDLTGPSLKDLTGPSLKDLVGETITLSFAEVFSSPSLSEQAFSTFETLTSTLTATNLVDLTLDTINEVDDLTAAALRPFADAITDAAGALQETLGTWVAHVGSVPRAKLILHAGAAIGALLKFFDTPESTRHPDALAINLLAVLVAVGWLLYAIREAKPASSSPAVGASFGDVDAW